MLCRRLPRWSAVAPSAGPRTCVFRRFKSKVPDESSSDDTTNNVPANGPSSNEIEQHSPDLSSKVSRPSGSLPSIDPKLAALMNKPKVEYNPLDNKEQVSYEFHSPKPPSEQKSEDIKARRHQSKLRRLLPSLLVGGGALWLLYVYDSFTADPNKDTDTELLRKDKFLPYVVSFKHQVDEDHFLIELTRKNRGSLFNQHSKLFDGKTIWSIEIKQPEINIVRNYTPLPLYVAGLDPDTREPHLRLLTRPEEEGKFVLLVKRYPTGEFSRWLTSRQLLSEVEVRGPHVEYKFPFHPLDKFTDRPQLGPVLSKIKPDPAYPENLPQPETFAFYGAGTGVLPLLQLLYSPNPPKVLVRAYVSLSKESNLPDQFKTLNYFAEKCGRAHFTYLVSEHGQRLGPKHVDKPTLPHFSGLIDLKVSDELYKQRLLAKKKQEVRRQLSGGTGDDADKPLEFNAADAVPKIDVPMKAQSAFQQFNFFSTQSQELPNPSFALVCGPEKYIGYVSGRPDLNNLELVDKGDIGGLLKEKGWTLGNIKRLI